MRFQTIAFLALAIGAVLTGQEALAGSTRSLLIFAENGGSPKLSQQLRLCARDADGMQKRELRIVPVTSDLQDAESKELRTRYHVKEGEFLVILLGPEGKEALRSTEPVEAKELFSKLDH